MILTKKIEKAIYKKAPSTSDPKRFIKCCLMLVELYDECRYTEDEVIERLCR